MGEGPGVGAPGQVPGLGRGARQLPAQIIDVLYGLFKQMRLGGALALQGAGDPLSLFHGRPLLFLVLQVFDEDFYKKFRKFSE